MKVFIPDYKTSLKLLKMSNKGHICGINPDSWDSIFNKELVFTLNDTNGYWYCVDTSGAPWYLYDSIFKTLGKLKYNNLLIERSGFDYISTKL